jgi:hypothetical protein
LCASNFLLYFKFVVLFNAYSTDVAS